MEVRLLLNTSLVAHQGNINSLDLSKTIDHPSMPVRSRITSTPKLGTRRLYLRPIRLDLKDLPLNNNLDLVSSLRDFKDRAKDKEHGDNKDQDLDPGSNRSDHNHSHSIMVEGRLNISMDLVPAISSLILRRMEVGKRPIGPMQLLRLRQWGRIGHTSLNQWVISSDLLVRL
jgi:hypothetical protein